MSLPILFPNAPPLPGVPPLARVPGMVYSGAAPVFANANVPAAGVIALPDIWGVFTAAGAQALAYDAVNTLEYTKSMRISDYPQEQGGFQSYNKVATPYECTLRLVKAVSYDGDGSVRGAFLSALEALLIDVSLLTIVMPEYSFPNANLESYTFRRTSSNGARLILADCKFLEIRQSAVANYGAANPSTPASPTATQDPSAEAVTNGGLVQSTDAANPVPYYLQKPVN